MTILTTSSSPQSISVIPRFEPTGTITFILRSEDQSKTIVNANISQANYTYSNGYLSFDRTFSPVLVESEFHNITIKEQGGSERLIFRGKAFVTDQAVLPKFTTQEGEFTEYSGNNNEYIIIS